MKTPRSRRRVLACAISAAGLLAACGPQQVTLSIRFPSTETFLVSRSMRIRVYPLEGDVDCPTLVTAVASSRDPGVVPIYSVEEITPCQVRSGLAVPDVGEGRHAFLVESLGRTGNETILAGCVEGEVYAGGRLSIALYPTSDYDDAFQADMPGTTSIEQRCGGGS